MVIDLNRKCDDPEHKSKKFPLIGIEPSGSGVRYMFACGHDTIIQVVGGNKYPEMLKQLEINSLKSMDELYEEFAELQNENSRIRTAAMPNRKLGELFFNKLEEKFKKILCEKFQLCKKYEYLITGIPPTTGLLIADSIIEAEPDVEYKYLILATSILMGFSMIQLKKFCNC